MSWEIGLGIAGVVLALIMLIGTAASFMGSAVWAVARVQSTTETLRQSIDHLTEAFTGLRTWMAELTIRQNDYGERLARVEARLDVCNEEDG